jgi:hypothetical protein
MYKWIDNHWLLSIVVLSYALIAIKEVAANVALVDFNKTLCMTSAIP